MREITREKSNLKKLAIISILFAILLTIMFLKPNKVEAAEKYGEFYLKEDNCITRILPHTTVDDLKNNLEIDGNSNVKVINTKGKELEDNEYVGSGMTLIIGEENYLLSVIGDINGDGKITVSDLVQLRLSMVNLLKLDNANLKAKDINNDGKATISDLVQIRFIIVGMTDIIAPESFTPKITKGTNSVTIEGETTDNSKGAVEYYFKIDNGDWVSNSDKTKSTYTFDGIDIEAEHTVRMKVSDKSGNQKKSRRISTNQIYAKLYRKSAEDKNGTLVFTSTDRIIPEYGTVEKDYGDIANKVFSEYAWKNDNNIRITEAIIEDKIKPVNTRYWFADCISLTEIKKISNLDTSKVTDMSSMFFACNNITTLNVNNFDTSNVTNMENMFMLCEELTELNVSNFNTSNVTNMKNMFDRCRKLKQLDLSNFDTIKVTDMSSMFSACNNITMLDLSNFDTNKVTDMSDMFGGCSNLTTLDVSQFDTGNVTNMSCMFCFCDALTELSVSNFNTSKVTDMDSMFLECKQLTQLDLSNFDTSKVTDMDSMFFVFDKLKVGQKITIL